MLRPNPTRYVLVVERDDARRATFCEAIEHEGFLTVAVPALLDALPLAAEAAEPFVAVVTDDTLDAGDGRKLAEALAARRPEVLAVHTNGFVASSAPLRMFHLDGSSAFTGVGRLVARLLDHGQPSSEHSPT